MPSVPLDSSFHQVILPQWHIRKYWRQVHWCALHTSTGVFRNATGRNYSFAVLWVFKSSESLWVKNYEKFSKTVKTSNQKGAVKNKLQLKNFIYNDPLAKYFLTEMDVQDQFLSRADREIKKGIFVVNDQWSTMLGQLWLLIFLILE